jgi:hypothetical protein
VAAAVYLVLLLAFFVFGAGFPLHRREFDQAYIAWLDNPNQQTESLLHAQSRKTLMVQLEDSAAAALVIWVAGFTCYEVIRRFRRPSDSLTAKLSRASRQNDGRTSTLPTSGA